jgi:hypothetical protein
MSVDVYLRAANRETKVWMPFLYAANFTSGQVTERAVIFGLYAGGYNNQHAYLLDIEATDLANLLADYNMKIAGLSNEEVIVLQSILAKRYVAEIEQQIHAEQLITKTDKVNADAEELEAKIAALSADQAALVTLATRLTTETAVSAAKLLEIESRKTLEDINLSLADIENAEKEIQLEKVKLQILDVANEVLKIQIQIVDAGIDLVNTDVKISETNSRTIGVRNDILKTDIFTADKDALSAHKTAVETESEIFAAEEDIVNNKQTLANSEETDLTLLLPLEIANATNEKAFLSAKYTGKLTEKEMSGVMKQVEELRRANSRTLELKNMRADIDTRDAQRIAQTGGYPTPSEDEAVSGITARIPLDHDGHALGKGTDSSQVYASYTAKMAVLTAATLMAKANIVNTLTHSIAKAPS